MNGLDCYEYQGSSDAHSSFFSLAQPWSTLYIVALCRLIRYFDVLLFESALMKLTTHPVRPVKLEVLQISSYKAPERVPVA